MKTRTTNKGQISPVEYLRKERKALYRHEYFEGDIIAMAGASIAHNDIVSNLVREIGYFLKDKPCRMWSSDMRVCTPGSDAYMYPDVTIVCGMPELEDQRFDTCKNPVAIFEVLSSSTFSHDRERKFYFYKKIPSFREYVLIDTVSHFAEVSRRGDDGTWKHDSIADPEGFLEIGTINFRLPMKELYRNVRFL